MRGPVITEKCLTMGGRFLELHEGGTVCSKRDKDFRVQFETLCCSVYPGYQNPKPKSPGVCLRELPFADNATVVTDSDTDLQRVIDQLYSVCSEFGLTISVKKTRHG